MLISEITVSSLNTILRLGSEFIEGDGRQNSATNKAQANQYCKSGEYLYIFKRVDEVE